MAEKYISWEIQNLAELMKRDWNNRASENAKWYINTVKVEQTDEEFYETARPDIQSLVLADMPRLAQGRDPKSLRCLEIGCGIGRMTWFLADIFGEVYGTDVSGEMIQQAQERLQHFSNVKAIETSGADFKDLPDEYFDIIFSAYVFQHVPSVEIVRSNIIDAFRLLKPGGVFKFQANTTVNSAFEQMSKDTWAGVNFSEEEIRSVASELNAQIISLAGMGGQYGWVMLRKRSTENVSQQGMMRVLPPIEGFTYNDYDAPPYQWGGHTVNRTFATLYVSGITGLELSVDQISVNLAQQVLRPCFVMDLGSESETVIRSGITTKEKMITLVHFEVLRSLLESVRNLQVQLKLHFSSPLTPIELPPPARPSLKIHLITNYFDSGVDVFANGQKSRIRIMTEGLDKNVALNDLLIRVGIWEAQPCEIEYTPSNGLYYLHVQLPDDTKPGETEVTIRYQDIWAKSVLLKIQ